MKLTLTLRELKDNYNWDKVCEVLGLNPWCLNEGYATGDEEENITEEQAIKIGILSIKET